MPQQRLQQGRIVWVSASDPRGRRKRRPVVIVTGDAKIGSHAKIVGVAVTTSFPEPPPPSYVELPWDPTGRASTGLRRRSAAVCNWLVAFESHEVDAAIGTVPSAMLLAILQALPKQGKQH